MTPPQDPIKFPYQLRNLTAVLTDFPIINTSTLLEQLLPASSNPLEILPLGYSQ